MENQLDIELVIFDMDGLMFDTEKISFEAWKEAINRYNYQIDSDLFEKTIGTNLNKTKEILEQHFGDGFPFDLISHARVQISADMIASNGVPIKNGLNALLDFLKQKHMKMAVATSTSRKRAMNLIRLAQIEQYFDYILCGDEIVNSKPNPEIFLKVASALNCPPHNCLVLEDSELGIKAAYNAGMIPIMIPDLKEPCKETQLLLFRRMESLTDVIDFLESITERRNS